MDTLIGQAKELTDPIFKVTGGLRLLHFLRQRRRYRFLYAIYLLNEWLECHQTWMDISLRQASHFGDLDLIFKVTGGLYYVKISLASLS